MAAQPFDGSMTASFDDIMTETRTGGRTSRRPTRRQKAPPMDPRRAPGAIAGSPQTAEGTAAPPGAGAVGPVVYDFETDLEALLVIDRTARGIETSVGDQAGGTPHPDIDAHPHAVAIGVGCRRDRHRAQGLIIAIRLPLAPS